MLNLSRSSLNVLIIGLVASVSVARQQSPAPQNQSSTPALQQWEDAFDGHVLDASKWDNFAIRGSAAQAQVEGGQLKLRIANNSRSGIRSKQYFDGERFLAEATIARANAPAPLYGSGASEIAWDATHVTVQKAA